MKARAPGKLVVSGAYAVLEGAPSLVVAVDRYVTADSDRVAARVTAELSEALARSDLGAPPWFDAGALRAADRKLGLGSSAAILVACLGAMWPPAVSDEELPEQVFPLALSAHRAAQGGGSGIDVAAACFGGALWCRLAEDGSVHRELAALPATLQVEVWSCPQAASTRDLLAALRAFRERDPQAHDALMKPVHIAAEGARSAVGATELVAAVGRGYLALGALGRAAGVAIVTPEMEALDGMAQGHGCRFGPAGAGGGDVALHLGSTESPPQLRAHARALGLCLEEMRLAAPGLHRAG